MEFIQQTRQFKTMNNIWVLANEQEMLRNFCLPIEVAQHKRNRLWRHKNWGGYPPLHFIADFKADLPPQFTYLVIKTIQEESQGHGNDGGNPLERLGQCSLCLYPKEIPPMLEIISEIANSLPEQNEQKVFEPLNDQDELIRLGIKGIANTDIIENEVYTMRSDRDLPDHKKDIYPIIRIKISENQIGQKSLYFWMGYFNLSDLEPKRPQYPFVYLLHPGLYLKQNGILELIELIKAHSQLLMPK
jgi:hypothetical protein